MKPQRKRKGSLQDLKKINKVRKTRGLSENEIYVQYIVASIKRLHLYIMDIHYLPTIPLTYEFLFSKSACTLSIVLSSSL